MDRCLEMLPPIPAEKNYLPYLGPGLDAGLATLFAEEIFEAIRILNSRIFMSSVKISLIKALRNLGRPGQRHHSAETRCGIRGRLRSGFAAIVGSAPSVEEACALAMNIRPKNLYVFMAAKDIEGKTSFAEQLIEGGMQIGWPTRLVPFGPEISAAVFALGLPAGPPWPSRIKPGAALKNLIYNKDRVFAFVNALSTIRMNGTPMRPVPSTGASRPSPTRTSPGAAHRYLYL